MSLLSLYEYLFWLRNDVIVLLLCRCLLLTFPHAGLIHTISSFLWEFMDANYIGSIPTWQPSPSSCQNHSVKSKYVLGEIQNLCCLLSNVYWHILFVKLRLLLKCSFAGYIRTSAGWIMLNLNFFACWIAHSSRTPRFFSATSPFSFATEFPPDLLPQSYPAPQRSSCISGRSRGSSARRLFTSSLRAYTDYLVTGYLRW